MVYVLFLCVLLIIAIVGKFAIGIIDSRYDDIRENVSKKDDY